MHTCAYARWAEMLSVRPPVCLSLDQNSAKKHLGQKAENAIFKSRKPEKLENMLETEKHNLKFAETGKSPF